MIESDIEPDPELQQLLDKMKAIITLYDFEFLQEVEDYFNHRITYVISVYKNIDDGPDVMMDFNITKFLFYQPDIYKWKYMFNVYFGNEDIYCDMFIDPFEVDNYSDEYKFIQCDDAFNKYIEAAMHVLLHAYKIGVDPDYFG